MGAISELIRTHRAEILRAWTDAAKRAASARDLTSPELASLMPEYLSLLGGPDPRPSAAQQALIERHLANRLREGFNLNEILTEFAVLGRCVSPFLEAAAGDQASVAEVANLYAELYQAATAVTRIFNEHVLEDAQTMKRYARLLDNLATDAFGFEDPLAPLLERLHEVLGLIVEAMGARTAALLLLDGAGGQPTATVGPGAAELAQVARSLEATTFAGRSGATGTEAAGVQVPGTLRDLGVQSLLRVRLPTHDILRCVLYVGIAEERPFSASEVRRLEGLSDALTTHLDSAHLRGALRRKEHELQAERELRERVVSVLVRDLRGPLALVRSSIKQRGDEAAATIEIVERLDKIMQVVDGFLATTPALPAEGAR